MTNETREELITWLKRIGQQVNDARHRHEPVEMRITRLEVLVAQMTSNLIDEIEAGRNSPAGPT